MRTPILALVFSVSAAACAVEYTATADWYVDNAEVAARAEFGLTPGYISVTLTNLFDQPTSVAQGLSGLSFTLKNGSAADASLQSSLAQEIKIAKKGGYQSNGYVPTGWMLRASGTTLELYVLGASIGPAHLLLGAGPYGDANSSIAGSKPHNPFLREVALFEIAAPWVTAATRISDVVFSFGSGGTLVEGATDDIETIHNPEPASLLLMGGGLAAVLLLSSKYARKVGAAGGLGSVARRSSGSRIPASPAVGAKGPETC